MEKKGKSQEKLDFFTESGIIMERLPIQIIVFALFYGREVNTGGYLRETLGVNPELM
jgi:hypothetical protein